MEEKKEQVFSVTEESLPPEESSVSNGKELPFREKLLNELKNASPLDTFSILEQVEMYDETEARQVIEDVYKEFESGENKVETIVVPVFTSVVDGVLQSLGDNKPTFVTKGDKMGLSATRIVQECRMFRYGATDANTQIYSEVAKNQMFDGYGDFNEKVGTNIGTYEREKYDFKQSQRAAALKKQTVDGKVKDGYQEKMLYATKKEAIEAEGNIKNSAQYEHIVALHNVHEQLKGNCMLADQDVRDIANMEENFVFTAAELNQSKGDMSNEEYVKTHKRELNRETRRNMVKKSREAQKKIDNAANKAVMHNIQNPEQLKKLGEQMENVAKDATQAGVQVGIGNAIIELMKPLYYEMADSFKNGFVQGVGANSMGIAFKVRMGRIKNHLRKALKGLALGSFMDLIKSVISSIISAIVDLFFGMVKNLLKLLQKGIPIVVSAFKILFDKTKSLAERGDAAVKLIGSSLIAILGGMLVDSIFKENPVGVMKVLKSICTCLISGCGSLFFMMLMDKIDLFDAKAEKRQERIREIFEERRKDLQQRAECMQVDAINVLKNQRLQFNSLISGAEQAIAEHDADSVTRYSYGLADFFGVRLEYSNTQEFVKWWDRQQIVKI